MSKELEEIKSIVAIHFGALGFLNLSENEQILKDRDKVLNALTELQFIKEANPSEALECLEKLKGMEISSMPFSDEYGTQEVDLNDIRKVGSQLNTDFREYINTIKQALLKAQYYNSNNFKGSKEVKIEIPEQELMDYNPTKQYLKWEDLEFKKEEQTMKVILNGKIYVLDYKFYTYEHNVIYLSTLDYDKVLTCLGDYNFDIQFFNDLRLERVEE